METSPTRDLNLSLERTYIFVNHVATLGLEQQLKLALHLAASQIGIQTNWREEESEGRARYRTSVVWDSQWTHITFLRMQEERSHKLRMLSDHSEPTQNLLASTPISLRIKLRMLVDRSESRKDLMHSERCRVLDETPKGFSSLRLNMVVNHSE
jgi:hypothetical protein